MPRTDTSQVLADRMQAEYERLRRRNEYNAEFMHAKDMHNDLAYYEMRQQRGQVDRYRRAVWRMNNPVISQGIFTEIFNAQSVPSRAPSMSMTQTPSGQYGRITDTFVMELANQDMVNWITSYINNYGYERLESQGLYIRRHYRHDTDNLMRNINMCDSYSYWSIESRVDRAGFMGDPIRLLCLGCGIDGGLSI